MRQTTEFECPSSKCLGCKKGLKQIKRKLLLNVPATNPTVKASHPVSPAFFSQSTRLGFSYIYKGMLFIVPKMMELKLTILFANLMTGN